MSRSYKKVLGHTGKSTYCKKQAARKVRRASIDTLEISTLKNNKHKRMYDQYNICDWKSLYFTEAEAKEWNRKLHKAKFK